MPDEQTCETCVWQRRAGGEDPCRKCPCAYVSQWQPLPAQPEAEATLEALDALCSLIPLLPDSPLARRIQEVLRSLRPLAKLVEEAECKARIVAAGCHWSLSSMLGIAVSYKESGWIDQATWPEAAAWAESQAPQEKWSEPVRDMTESKMLDCLEQIGGKLISPTWNTYHYLRGYADHAGLYDPTTDRVKLPA